jgi:5'-phosphate synthase pdxT subunit
MTIGVLALQGDFESHAQMLQSCDPTIEVLPVRDAQALARVDGLIIPGGESTTMSRLCDRYELWQPLQQRIVAKMPVLGTCAGLIMLAQNISGASQNFAQKTLQALDVDVARNAYGAQIESFETEVEVPALQKAGLGDTPLRVFFIRAPQITRVGEGVEVLATHAGLPVLVQRDKIFAATFHSEIARDWRLHALWLRAFSTKL